MKEYVNDSVEVLESNIDENTGFLWTGGSEAQVIAHMLLHELEVDVDFLTVDTRNQLQSVQDFRDQYHDNNNFTLNVRRHEDLIDAIQDDDDPRGYHGEWDESAEKGVGVSREEWTIERSCGQLKVVPMREFIETDGYGTLITGMKESDPTAPDDISNVVTRREPSTHTRINPLCDWSEEHVWAYIKFHFVSYPDCYDNGIRHTDSECCMADDGVSEHNPEGFDPEMAERQQKLQEMGYV